MLNDAKQRNDVLGRAYETLHAEYILLKTHQYSDQGAYTDSHLSSGYNSALSVSGSSSNDRLDMDLYVYSDMAPTAYSL